MTELAAPQISSLMEALPGIAHVLRSPVANAIVALSRAGAGLEEYAVAHAEELMRYGVRRNLLTQDEVDRVLAEIMETPAGKASKPLVIEKPKRPTAPPISQSAHKPAPPAAPVPATAVVPAKAAAPVTKAPATKAPATKAAPAKPVATSAPVKAAVSKTPPKAARTAAAPPKAKPAAKAAAKPAPKPAAKKVVAKPAPKPAAKKAGAPVKKVAAKKKK